MRRSFVVPVIIGINVVVFLLWTVGGNASFLSNNFSVSFESLASGRWWTALTAVFSHNMLWHLLLNMFVLSSFGPVLERSLGSGYFLRFYLIAGVFSSIAHAVLSAWLLDAPDLQAVGASGAISGLILLFSLMYPSAKILLFGIIPLPALWGCALVVGIDVWGLFSQIEGGGLPIGHGAHLGGAAIGILWYFLFVRRRLVKRPLSPFI